MVILLCWDCSCAHRPAWLDIFRIALASVSQAMCNAAFPTSYVPDCPVYHIRLHISRRIVVYALQVAIATRRTATSLPPSSGTLIWTAPS